MILSALFSRFKFTETQEPGGMEIALFPARANSCLSGKRGSFSGAEKKKKSGVTRTLHCPLRYRIRRCF